MKDKIKAYLKSVPRHFWILALIIIVGVFFRTYHFHDWLLFSPDQARDATIISDVINGKSQLPPLGPQAGNIQFYLGPFYYQMEYVAALFFGNQPDKLAYPDLLFSILAIPLMYFFLRKYFTVSIALILDALMSFSYFMIVNSRFASNPNSIPFFTLLFLYALLEMMDSKNKEKIIWPILVGIAMGVGTQLHALLFLIMPAIAFLVCLFLIKKKNLTWKSFVLVVVFFALMNVGQLTYEIKSGGANTLQLFRGANSESSMKDNFFRNISLVASCQAQANLSIASSLMNVEDCGNLFNVKRSVKKYQDVPGAFTNEPLFLIGMILTVLFSIGGYFLAFFYFKKDVDDKRRNFLGLFLLYNLISFIALVPVASQISVRYFSILFFIPFVLLGLWFDLLLKNKKKYGLRIMAGMVFVLIFAQLFVLNQAARPYSNESASNVNKGVLGETESMVAYMMLSSDVQSKSIKIDGQKAYLKRFLKPFDYISQKSGIQMITPGKGSEFKIGMEYFYIDKNDGKNHAVGDKIKDGVILGLKNFQNITIYKLQIQ